MSEMWRRLEREVSDQFRAEPATDDVTALPAGHSVAWALCRFGRTDGFSPVHRVGESIRGTAMTLCGDVIPEAVRLVPLTPNLVRTLGRCQFCEHRNAKQGVAA